MRSLPAHLSYLRYALARCWSALRFTVVSYRLLAVGRPSPHFIALLTSVVLLAFITSVIIGAVSAAPPTKPEARPEFGTYPPDCGHLYNNDSHAAWNECMGVGYK